MRPRSGLALKHGIILPNAPGTIDADYRGEVCVILANLGPEPVGSHGETVARLLRPGFHSGTVPKLFARLKELPKEQRGAVGREINDLRTQVESLVSQRLEELSCECYEACKRETNRLLELQKSTR